MAAVALPPIDRDEAAAAAAATVTAGSTLAWIARHPDDATTPELVDVARQLVEALHATLSWQRRTVAEDELLAALAKWL